MTTTTATGRNHLIGLLLGAEQDWPQAFEQVLRMVGPVDVRRHDAQPQHRAAHHRALRPRSTRSAPSWSSTGSRTGTTTRASGSRRPRWSTAPTCSTARSRSRRWRSTRRTARCSASASRSRRTILVPYKNPVDNVRWAYTSEKYNRDFDLDAIAAELGYPMYMKPFDGGGWRGVSRINDQADLHRAYDESGEMLMHLQATVEYEHFARALSIGPETMVMDFRPDQPMHQRYHVSHGFLSESAGEQTVAISRIVNAFFRWEFNSCEMLVAGDDVYPIDYANACPDVALTSLHYYFPWAITALVRWSTYCAGDGSARRTSTCRPRATSPSPTTPTCRTTRSWRPTSPSPTSTSRPSATGTGAPSTCRTSRRRCVDWVASERSCAAHRDRPAHVPRARAGRVHGPLQGPARACGSTTSGAPAAAGSDSGRRGQAVSRPVEALARPASGPSTELEPSRRRRGSRDRRRQGGQALPAGSVATRRTRYFPSGAGCRRSCRSRSASAPAAS